MLEKTHYKNGRRVYRIQGNRLTFFHKNGKIKAEGIYENKLMQGEWKFYYTTGQLSQTGTFRNSKKQGPWTRYSKENKLMSQTLFEDDKVVRNKKEEKPAVSVKKIAPTTVDEYVANFPADIQKKLNLLREIILKAAPEAKEKLSWGKPTFTIKKTLVQFAAFTKHINFFPSRFIIETFANDLLKHKTGKETIKFPYDKPLPTKLITKIIKFRVKDITSD
ncbi:MAG: DUF1801 domain-containing protein [Prevotellaceae bacterium]|jgi:uncharacterized protein YdhG (YjbR/CyaY superfamily)|nr:DUF1801 domain-containing protein [Prevotellaceae bacterium]